MCASCSSYSSSRAKHELSLVARIAHPGQTCADERSPIALAEETCAAHVAHTAHSGTNELAHVALIAHLGEIFVDELPCIAQALKHVQMSYRL